MIYDLIVIGGGPAGMMAAGRAAENGAHVLLLEKNKQLGVKLLITGKGRCNITNAEPELKKFINQYGSNGKFLYSALNKFSPEETIIFFNNLGVATKIERGQRVFPVSNRADAVLLALIKYLNKNQVEIKLNTKVEKIVSSRVLGTRDQNRIEKIILNDDQELRAKKYLMATGGKSYPATGSDGAGFKWLEKMGHHIIEPRPALVGIVGQENWLKDLEGLSLKNVTISVYQNNKKMDSRFGEAIFTAGGLSGPIILDMSKKIAELLEKGQVSLKIDFKPALDEKTLDQRIQSDFLSFKNKMFKNSLAWLLPQKMIALIIKLSGIETEKKVNMISKLERQKILDLLKNFTLQVKKTAGFGSAIITAGGVDLKEVDPETMHSKIINNLILAGEILDLDGPTGGFNLQVCWSSGYVAGENII
ncbi:MAG TPA: NAD(P)/FAD-dependent oxidoreductase [bacterium]|mgnify:CR=1 FL=1|nr:NAD(P)/FAD-dependent oxidoreductase [bacterium]